MSLLRSEKEPAEIERVGSGALGVEKISVLRQCRPPLPTVLVECQRCRLLFVIELGQQRSGPGLPASQLSFPIHVSS